MAPKRSWKQKAEDLATQAAAIPFSRAELKELDIHDQAVSIDTEARMHGFGQADGEPPLSWDQARRKAQQVWQDQYVPTRPLLGEALQKRRNKFELEKELWKAQKAAEEEEMTARAAGEREPHGFRRAARGKPWTPPRRKSPDSLTEASAGKENIGSSDEKSPSPPSTASQISSDKSILREASQTQECLVDVPRCLDVWEAPEAEQAFRMAEAARQAQAAADEVNIGGLLGEAHFGRAEEQPAAEVALAPIQLAVSSLTGLRGTPAETPGGVAWCGALAAEAIMQASQGDDSQAIPALSQETLAALSTPSTAGIIGASGSAKVAMTEEARRIFKAALPLTGDLEADNERLVAFLSAQGLIHGSKEDGMDIQPSWWPLSRWMTSGVQSLRREQLRIVWTAIEQNLA